MRKLGEKKKEFTSNFFANLATLTFAGVFVANLFTNEIETTYALAGLLFTAVFFYLGFVLVEDKENEEKKEDKNA